MNQKENLIEALNKILDSQSNLSAEDRTTLIHVRNELIRSKNKKEMRAALTPLLKLVHFVKEIIELFTG